MIFVLRTAVVCQTCGKDVVSGLDFGQFPSSDTRCQQYEMTHYLTTGHSKFTVFDVSSYEQERGDPRQAPEEVSPNA